MIQTQEKAKRLPSIFCPECRSTTPDRAECGACGHVITTEERARGYVPSREEQADNERFSALARASINRSTRAIEWGGIDAQ